LLDAAERVLVAQGLRATTVADVADAAGVAKGTMYLYFSSKDELLAGLRARYVESYTAAIAASDDAPVSDQVHRLVTGLFDFGAKHRDLHHLLFHEAGFSEADAFSGLRSRLETLVRDGNASGAFAVGDVGTTTSFILNGVHGSLVDALHRSSRAAQKRVAVETADLVLRVLTPSD
jgi:AcrR family transcriptional regulator